MKKVIYLILCLASVPAFAETYDCTGIGAGLIAITGSTVTYVNWGAAGTNFKGSVISRSYGQTVLAYEHEYSPSTVILNPVGNGQYKYDVDSYEDSSDQYCTRKP